jgi:hypothetical protein
MTVEEPNSSGPRRFVVFGVKLQHVLSEFYSVLYLTGEMFI